MRKNESLFFEITIIVLTVLLIFAGVKFLNDRNYGIISVTAAFLACMPFYISYDARNHGIADIVLVSVMISLTVTGRLIFAVTPFFKPVTAMVIITGFYLGRESGFLTGSLAALITNMFMAQGPWTPFQMFVWGMTGFIAGCFKDRKITENKIFLIIYAAISGILFSMTMDIWTVLSLSGVFTFSAYRTAIITSLPVMAIYIISDIVFLLVLIPHFRKRFIRIQYKYSRRV